MEGEREMERTEWKTTARSTKDREKRAFSLLPALRTWLINHLYAINHQESTAGLTRSIQMPLKLVERRVRHGHTTWPSVEETHKNHRVVCQCQNLYVHYGGWTWDLVMIATMLTQPCNPMCCGGDGGGAIFVILYANPQMSTKSLPCFVAASDCNRCCLNKDELNWISHIYHPKSPWKRRKHRCSTWIKGQKAVNKLIESQSVHVLPKSTPSNISFFFREVKTTPANTHK